MRKRNLHIIALLLILAFTQKLGLRVLLHNKYHAAIKLDNTGSTASYYQVQCDCIDEALTPFYKAPDVLVPQPEKSYLVLQGTVRISLSSAIKIYRSLRAPPSIA
jgi:hypothetical protein